MAKLKLLPVAKPTFTKTVKIPVPGSNATAELDLRFRWRTRDQIREWIESLGEKSNPAIIMEMLDGWELEDQFTEEVVAKFDQDFPGACSAIYTTYLSELSGAKAGN